MKFKSLFRILFMFSILISSCKFISRKTAQTHNPSSWNLPMLYNVDSLVKTLKTDTFLIYVSQSDGTIERTEKEVWCFSVKNNIMKCTGISNHKGVILSDQVPFRFWEMYYSLKDSIEDEKLNHPDIIIGHDRYYKTELFVGDYHKSNYLEDQTRQVNEFSSISKWLTYVESCLFRFERSYW